MAIKEWSTTYTGGTPVQDPDPVTTNQPDLVNGSDDTRVSQIHALRNKVHAVAKEVGDNADNPPGCLKDRVTTLEAAGTPISPPSVEGRVSGSALPQTISSIFPGAYDDITGLSQSVTVETGDHLLIVVRLQGLPASTSSCVARTRVLVGATEYLLAQQSVTTQLDLDLGGSIVTAALTAGTYTVKVQGGRQLLNWTCGPTGAPWADMEVVLLKAVP